MGKKRDKYMSRLKKCCVLMIISLIGFVIVAEKSDICGIYLDLAIYKNIKSVGKALIEEYENENMLDYLEETFGVHKDDIEEVFENINENKFMQKKILSFLNERFPY